MNEWLKTGLYVGVAAILGIVAYTTAPKASRDVSSFIEDRVLFYPDARPANVKGLEVTAFSKDLGEVDNFSVKLENGEWVIPSHNNYPADAEERLKNTAGAVLGLVKDSVVSDSKESHRQFGVIDPTDTAGDKDSWGTRIKLADADGNEVSDLIIGKDVPEKANFKYVRLPDKDRVYQVDCGSLSVSTEFTDWINTTLIEDGSFTYDKIKINDYRIVPDGQVARVENKGVINVEKKDGNWTLADLKEGEETDTTKVGELATAIGNLKIAGVRPKPPGLSPDLNALEAQLVLESMARRGFFVANDGRVLSNEGELSVETTEGLVYTLRLGGLLIGRGEDVEAGKEDEKAAEAPKPEEKKEGEEGKAPTVEESRFLLVSVGFNENRFPPIEPPAGVEEKPADAKPNEVTPPAPPADAPKPEESKPAETKPEEGKPAEEPKAEPAPTESKEPTAAPAEEPQLQNVGYQPPAEAPADPPAEAPAAEPASAEQPKSEPAPDAPKTEAPSEEEAKKKAEEEAAMKQAQEAAAKAKLEADKREYEAKKAERERKIADGKKKQKEMEQRYGKWFYVVPNEAAKKIRVSRADLVKKPEPKEGEKPAEGNAPSDPAAAPESAEPAKNPAEPAAEPAPAEPAPEKKEAEKPAEPTPANPDQPATP